ncbi:MAG: ABC transporter substrate-binding protein [Microcystis sp. M114S2]|uniref:ABC transporter substrate-binding protein n=1 Tax=unclassified Microcystis TaxID=2643300 RepID=UPI0025869892|nr:MULTISPECIES: ABC transporter substrate-binding protein [unclassified Microcystis]MCA2665713.1 ABC transporter substrate-binding protein [Microcystis sp. M045S2]MCA2713949.1 ABC transporter substrate-binding protein [Microcystis sp. M172S2]MCA2805407.1 ABC transporter substrate-binding protein [Microcystis sp. M114S2]MCA2832243.1 ABC transporter substrate-binding protein [Microcystis sp. M007S1]MCA2837384.1 ABC transporter substrate-binding protein [Microcystis sp. M078S1]
MLRKRLLIPLILSLVTFGLVVACNSGTPTGQTNPSPAENAATGAIPIGAALAQTSNLALLGQEQVIGVKMAETYFNKKGGVNGTPIKVIIQDVAGDEQGAINAINTLITQDKVVGILGPSLSQQAFAASPIADRAKVPILGPSNTAKGIPQIGEYVGRVSAPVAVVAPNAVKTALKIDPKIKKVAVFFAQNDAFSKSETETFQETLKSLNLDIVTVQKFQTTDTDFQNQATAAINIKPDLVVISGLVADGGNLVKQLRQLGYQGLIIGGNGLNTSNIFPVCQAQCDGILIAQAYNPELDNPINRDFVAAYTAENKKAPPQFTAQAFTGIQVFVEALKRVDDKNKLSTLSLEQIRQQLNQEILAGKYVTVLGDIAFTPEGEIIQDKFSVAQIKMDADGKNGKFTFVKN